MLETEVIHEISESLKFCRDHFCEKCPKSDACYLYFGSLILTQKILDLARICRKFNNSKENK